MSKHLLGFSALLAGVTALGLAVIPGIFHDQPLPWVGKKETPAAAEKPKLALQGDARITLKIKEVEVKLPIKGKAEKRPPAPQPEETDRAAAPANPVKWFTISAIAVALLGLVLGPLAWVREKQPILSGSAMALCCAALVWQYVLLGIMIGTGIAVILILFSYFG
jgi:hypothetical protein